MQRGSYKLGPAHKMGAINAIQLQYNSVKLMSESDFLKKIRLIELIVVNQNISHGPGFCLGKGCMNPVLLSTCACPHSDLYYNYFPEKVYITKTFFYKA